MWWMAAGLCYICLYMYLRGTNVFLPNPPKFTFFRRPPNYIPTKFKDICLPPNLYTVDCLLLEHALGIKNWKALKILFKMNNPTICIFVPVFSCILALKVLQVTWLPRSLKVLGFSLSPGMSWDF